MSMEPLFLLQEQREMGEEKRYKNQIDPRTQYAKRKKKTNDFHSPDPAPFRVLSTTLVFFCYILRCIPIL